jgi:hypothetical protein
VPFDNDPELKQEFYQTVIVSLEKFSYELTRAELRRTHARLQRPQKQSFEDVRGQLMVDAKDVVTTAMKLD